MRVLITSNPSYGHLLPLFPLARALREQGHRVAVMSGAVVATEVEPEGFEMLPVGPTSQVMIDEATRRTGLTPRDERTSPEFEAEFFAGTRVDLTTDEAIVKARAFAPELLVNERADLVGPLVATALGVPHASLNYAPALSAAHVAARTAKVRPRYLERGLPPPTGTPSGRWLLDTWPESMQRDDIPPWTAQRIPLRPEPHQGPGPVPAAPPAPRPGVGRPRVLVTFGTHLSDPTLVSAILGSLSRLDLDLVATMGLGFTPADFDLPAGRVELVPFVPLAQLLDGVSAVVQHGGAGTTLGALTRGIPMVIVSQGAGQSIQGDQIEAAGAGLSVPAGPDRPEATAAALRRVLAEASFGSAAHRLRDEIAAMLSPAEVAEQLTAALDESPSGVAAID